MKSTLRRYEVLLPVQYNDGRDVPEELLGEALLEVIDQFGAASFWKQGVEGFWQHGDTVYRDNLACIVVDIPDAKKNRSWMKAFKDRWKKRLDQLEIWMTSHPVDIE